MKSIKMWAMLFGMVICATTVCGQTMGYAVGNLKCVLDDGSGNIVTGAGQVFVSLSDEVTPEWVADEAQSEVSVVEGSAGSGWKHAFYYWAQANEGYEFVGFSTSKTSKTSSNNSVPYNNVYTSYSAKSEETPAVKQYYAIFKKVKKNEDVKPIDVTGLPVYSQYVATPATGEKIESVRTITIALSDDDYDDPITIMPAAPAVQIYRVDGGKHDLLPNVVIPSIQGGKLVLTCEPAVADTISIEVNVPAGLTNNLLMTIGTMTKEELENEGFCTNPSMQLFYTLEPGQVQPIRITNHTDSVDLPDAKLCYSTDSYVVSMGGINVTMINPNGQEVSYIDLHYENELVSCLKPAVIKDMVQIRQVEVDTLLEISRYTNGILEKDHKCLRICISTTSFINGVGNVGTYEVTIQSGIAVDINGLQTGAVHFMFEYCHPSPTSVNAMEQTEDLSVRKCLNNGKLYIIRDGVTYDVTGQRL